MFISTFLNKKPEQGVLKLAA